MNRHDIEVKQVATFTLPIRVDTDSGKPVDFTGYTATAQVREKPTSAVLYQFKDDYSTPYWIEWVDKAKGNLKLTITSANTANMTAGVAKYDIILKSNTNTVILLEGQFRVVDTITEV